MYDAILLLSFGGPEGMDDVRPFLANVLRGRPVPPERVEEVVRHYERFGGVSPINGQNRALLAALRARLDEAGPRGLAVYWGNRNWKPYLADTLREMEKDGVRRAIGFVTSAFSSYSGCRQYLEDVDRARAEVGAGAPVVDKVRPFYNHPRFIAANAELVRAGLAAAGPEARLVFTAHSIPMAMASACDYESQLREAGGWVARAVGHERWDLVYQSRSGPPTQPWLEPDILAHLQALASEGVRDVVVTPIGFVSDHLEVIYDLDTEAQDRARALGVRLVRVPTVSNHPGYVEMVRELILERVEGAPRATVGTSPALPDACAAGCCPRVRP
ncbi:MAG TPA: ferrochelatase [Vicinamibacteria bacterium]|nr:ferrochelatase [Vicinamibacteria bacterium]